MSLSDALEWLEDAVDRTSGEPEYHEALSVVKAALLEKK